MFECPICNNSYEETQLLSLECDHAFCQNCMKNWIKTKMEHGLNCIYMKKGRPWHLNGESSMMISLDNACIPCPLCRTEYTICNDNYMKSSHQTDQIVAPLKIRGRVWFSDGEDLAYCHHIVSPNDIDEYLPLRDRIISKMYDNPKMSKLHICPEQSAFSRNVTMWLRDEIFRDGTKDFHVVKQLSTGNKPVPMPADMCNCSNHATPAEFVEALQNYRG